MPSYACKKDANHDEIKDAFEGCFWAWLDTWQFAQYKPGFPDAIAVGPDGPVFVEIKDGNKPLTADEVKFHREWRGRLDIVVIHNVEEALDFMGVKSG